MNRNWVLGQGSLAASIQFQVVTVLAEYEGPQILLAKLNDQVRLGVAADAEGELVRWLFSPVTSVELLALAGGHCSTYASIVKDGMLVVDLNDDLQVVDAWDVPLDSLSEEVLPDPKSVLPLAARNVLAAAHSPVLSPRLTLGRTGGREPLSFRALSSVLSSFQRLWTTLAQAMEGDALTSRGRWTSTLEERATLGFERAVAGSLQIDMRAGDSALHEQVSDLFSALVMYSEWPDDQALRDVLLPLGPRAIARLNELLRVVEKSGIELLNENGSKGAYLSPSIATRALQAGRFEEKRVSVMDAASGFFFAFSETDAKFEFYDEIRDARISGDVDQQVISSNDAIVVGQGGSYGIVFEKVTRQVTALKHEVTFVLRGVVESAERD